MGSNTTVYTFTMYILIPCIELHIVTSSLLNKNLFTGHVHLDPCKAVAFPYYFHSIYMKLGAVLTNVPDLSILCVVIEMDARKQTQVDSKTDFLSISSISCVHKEACHCFEMLHFLAHFCFSIPFSHFNVNVPCKCIQNNALLDENVVV